MTGDTLEAMTGEIDLLRALAHPVRWGILERLAAEPGICACDFTEFFEVSQPTISAHLKVLREAGLVTAQRRGNTICYSLASARIAWLADRLASVAATAPSSTVAPTAPRSITAP
jgi:ArsR family transcriptional regulator, arsenate/arsenite/antimonite-responsive transcriptional repressor